jgi:hypothetical protein
MGDDGDEIGVWNLTWHEQLFTGGLCHPGCILFLTIDIVTVCTQLCPHASGGAELEFELLFVVQAATRRR